MKIIFLDIDGPMIPNGMFLLNRNASFGRQFSPVCIAVANEMCEMTGAKIVLNTTHNRALQGVPDIEIALIQQGLKDEHLFPEFPKTGYPFLDRSSAILEWLDRHPEVEQWVAVDDVCCAPAENMIMVDAHSGITTRHLAQVCALFGAQIPVFLT